MLALWLACAQPGTPLDTGLWGVPEHFPPAAVPQDNPMTPEKVELGRHLFYDPGLSVNGTRSCGICHEAAKGFTDGFVRALGATNEMHPRNTLSLANVAWREDLGWRGDAPSSLEEQVLVPLSGHDPLEMGMDWETLQPRLSQNPIYPPLWEAAYPGQEWTLEQVQQALASFERSIVGGGSPYDRYLRDGIPLEPAAERGRQLFFSRELACSRCHGGVFLDSPTSALGRVSARHGYFNTGLYNVDGLGAYPEYEQGLIEVTGAPEDMGVFRTPSLRNVAQSGPWLHDGSANDLGDVIDAYARGGRRIESGPNPGDGAENPYKHRLIRGFELSQQERSDLLAFLEALSDSSLMDDPRYQTPFCVVLQGEVQNAPCVDDSAP